MKLPYWVGNHRRFERGSFICKGLGILVSFSDMDDSTSGAQLTL
jgi:hypothetical protein